MTVLREHFQKHEVWVNVQTETLTTLVPAPCPSTSVSAARQMAPQHQSRKTLTRIWTMGRRMLNWVSRPSRTVAEPATADRAAGPATANSDAGPPIVNAACVAPAIADLAVLDSLAVFAMAESATPNHRKFATRQNQ